MVDIIADLSEDSKSHLEPIDLALKLIFELTDLSSFGENTPTSISGGMNHPLICYNVVKG